MMKNLLSFFLILFCFFSNLYSQENVSLWKINASTVLGFPGAAYERKISPKTSFQVEVFTSPWKSFLNNDLLFGILNLEYRYYKNQAFYGFYAAPNFGFANYHLQKWNYWNTNLTQIGISFLYGASIGYQFQYKKKWTIDLNIGGGHVQSFYKGYNKTTGVRLDSATHYNKSGEFIPYKLGVMINYRFK